MKYISCMFALLAMLLFASCNNDTTTTNKTAGSGDSTATTNAVSGESVTNFEAGGLKISALEGSTTFPDGRLTLKNPPIGSDLATGKNKFEFETAGFKLGEQTADEATKGLANSDKGQHIHFILNNGPYTALYEPVSEQTLEDGHYVMLAFLSRSYHESVKGATSFVLRQFNVGQPANFKELDTKAAHIFYSRPKGSYKGPKETTKVMLDFFLVNCDLRSDGYKVKATINGTEFTFTKWVPYTIEGLPMGENKIRLELIDANGKTVESAFNPVDRVFTLEAGA